MNILSSIVEKSPKTSDMIGIQEDYTNDNKDFVRYLDLHLGYIMEENEKNKETIGNLESKIENLLVEKKLNL